jgi:CDP-diacylglycerol--glycerol-3-phosphate 3-phosphatidyltransferase
MRSEVNTENPSGRASSEHQDERMIKPSISILNSPIDFYETILKEIELASNKIILTALYFGSGEQEQKIVTAINNALMAKSQLTFTCIFDYNRSSRDNFKALNALNQLKKSFPDRVNVNLFRTHAHSSSPFLSKLLQTWVPRPDFHEILGVFHCKYCIFDDTVLISGANLSTDYFTNRQDRYWLVQERSCAGPSTGASASNTLNGFLCDVTDILSRSYCHTLSADAAICPPAISALDEQRYRMKNDLLAAVDMYMSRTCSHDVMNNDIGYTTIRPVFQYSPVQLFTEQDCFLNFFKSLCARPKLSDSGGTLAQYATSASREGMEKAVRTEVCITTPYPSFFEGLATYLGQFVGTKAVDAQRSLDKSNSLEILIPAESAHGFHNGAGVKAWIPALHKAAASRTMDIIRRFGGHDGLRLYEYERQGWTYHAKGFWCNIFYSDPGPSNSIGKHYPDKVVTYIGSSNMGQRSWQRDFELGFVVHTTDKTLIKQTTDEYRGLKSFVTLLPSTINLFPKVREGSWKNAIGHSGVRRLAQALRSVL